jgi:hypothetical protein
VSRKRVSAHNLYRPDIETLGQSFWSVGRGVSLRAVWEFATLPQRCRIPLRSPLRPKANFNSASRILAAALML